MIEPGQPLYVQPDGTRVYRSYHRYTPVAPEDRVYGVRKPDDPRAVRWGGKWLLPLDVLPDAERAMPDTRPDEEAYEHRGDAPKCRCDVCRRPAAKRWKEKYDRDHGYRR